MIATKETVYLKDVKDIPWEVTQETFKEEFKKMIENDDLVSLTLDHLLSDGLADLFDYMSINIDEMLNTCLFNKAEKLESNSAFDHAVRNQPLNKYGYVINFVVKALVATDYEDFKVDLSKSDKHVVYINSYRLNLKNHAGAIAGLFNPWFLKNNKIRVNETTILPLLKILKEFIDANKTEGRRYLDVDDAIMDKRKVESLPDKYLKMNNNELIDYANEKLKQMEERPQLEGSLMDVAKGLHEHTMGLDLETAEVVSDLMKVVSYKMDNVIDRINLLKMSKRLKLSIYKFESNR